MKISTYLIKENNNLDLIRVVLASLVIFGHTIALNGPSRFWLDPIAKLFSFTYSGSLAVKLFFFISGMVLTNSLLKNGSIIKFAISRTFRLIPGLLLVLVITSLIFGPIVTNRNISIYFSDGETYKYIWSNLIFNTSYSLPGVFENNIYPNAVNGSLWSLHFEVGCYLALLGIFSIVRGKEKKYLNIILILIIIDTILPVKIFLGWLGNNPDINLLPFSFALGVLFAINAENLEVNNHTMLGSLILLFVLHDTPLAQLMLIVCSSIIVIVVSSDERFKQIRPKYDISYGIYLWGFVIQQLTNHRLGHIYAGFHFLITLMVSMVLGYLSYRFIELPSIKLGAKLYSKYKAVIRLRTAREQDSFELTIK